MNRAAFLVKLFLLIALPAAFAVVGAQPPEPAEPPLFRVDRAEGKPRRGAIREWARDWSVRLGQPDAGVIPGTDLLGLRQEGLVLPAFPEDPHVILVNGDRIPVTNPIMVKERLRFQYTDLSDGKDVEVPLSRIGLLWFRPPADTQDAEQFRRHCLNGPRKRDRVLLINGDAVEGDFTSLEDGKVILEDGNKKSTLDVNQVSAIVMGTDLAEAFKPRGVFARAVLLGNGQTEAARLTLTGATSDGTTLQGVTSFGATLKVPLQRLAALDLFGGRAVYLSDLKPSKYEFEPYLDVRWPLVKDGSVGGRELRIGPSVYTKGLGMHSHSRVTYNLGEGYRRLESQVGLDPRLGRLGSARIRVLGDGKPLPLDQTVTQADLNEHRQSLTIQTNVEGVKELTLETAFGTRGDVQAHVNWVDARLVK